MQALIRCSATRSSVLSSAAQWLTFIGMSDGHREMHVYRDLGRHPGAMVLTGTGRLTDGRDVAFVADVLEGEGVLEGLVLETDHLANFHALAAAVAHESGRSLLDVVEQMLAETAVTGT